MTRRGAENVLQTFLGDVDAMPLHRSQKLGQALKKPLLLLLVLSRLERGLMPVNRLDFESVRAELNQLIREYGGRPTGKQGGAEYPFSHLRSSSFWGLITQRRYESGHTVLVSDLKHPDTYASLRSDVYELLAHDDLARSEAFNWILSRWWPETLHTELREQLGMPEFVPGSRSFRRSRDQRFVAQVLMNYRYSCAMCGFHGLLNGQAVGVDACHIKWHSAMGDDALENGIALCKLHHWALDRGVWSIVND